MTAAQTEILSDQSGYRKTAGERLRRAREIKGLSQKDVANALNLMVSHVRAIESNRYNAQAEGEHFGGYLRAYARLVELDPQQIIDLYNAQGDASGADTVVLSSPVRASPPPRSKLSSTIGIGVAAVVCLAVLVWVMSRFGIFGGGEEQPKVADVQEPAAEVQQDPTPAQKEETVAASSPAVTEDQPPEVEPEQTSEPDTSAPSATRERPASNAEAIASASPPAVASEAQQQTRDIGAGAVVRSQESAAPVPVTGGENKKSMPAGVSPAAAARQRRERFAAQAAEQRASNASQATLSNIGIQQRAERTNRQSSRGTNRESDRRVTSTQRQDADTNTAIATGSDQLVLDFTTDCWVEIYDANGAALRLGVERAGDRLMLRGEAPFDVLVGFSRGVTMTLNGEPVPIRQHQFSDSTQLVVGGPDDYFGTQQIYDDATSIAANESTAGELDYVREDEIVERRDEEQVLGEQAIEADAADQQPRQADSQASEAQSDQQLAAAEKRVDVPARYSRPFAAPAPSTAEELEKAARQANSEKDDDRAAYQADDSQRSDATAPLTDKQDQLEFTFTAECWVEVYDVEKRPLVMDTKYAGETLELTGQGPFEVRVGNSRAVSLKVNGQKIEIKRDRYIGSTEFFVGSR